MPYRMVVALRTMLSMSLSSSSTLWPDFTAQDFYDALNWYQKQDVTLGG